jgi:RNA polymerase sigma factor (sigma-70 family)
MRPDEWEDLYRSAFRRVYPALVVTLMDREAALDALHDAFVEGLRKPPPDRRNVEGWLYVVALRRARRRFRIPVALPLVDRAVPDRALDDILDRDEVGQLLARLSQRQRAIVVAHYFLHQTQEEIARDLGVSRGTVSATISQSLARMREAPQAH